jgi:hypothetical protein
MRPRPARLFFEGSSAGIAVRPRGRTIHMGQERPISGIRAMFAVGTRVELHQRMAELSMAIRLCDGLAPPR